jgi:hypothetical protein
MSDLYIPRIGPLFPCSRIGRPILEIYKSLTDTVYECRNWETEQYNYVLEITASFREYINGNQTFILDSHWPFICSADASIDSLVKVDRHNRNHQ